MKKRNVINLIKYFTEGNSSAFRDEAYNIAEDFNLSGDTQLANYVLALLSNRNTFVPQQSNEHTEFLRKLDCDTESLPLPSAIMDDIRGIVNAVGYKAGVNKFLFSGKPGTGKTESAKNLARILNRDLYIVDSETLIDSKLGQTSKNISDLFSEINSLNYPEQVIVLFDELDSLALDRIDSKDLREMGRATSSVLKGLDYLNNDVVLIATTNLLDSFDKALLRRFDKIIDFNRYSQEDLMEIAEFMLDEQLSKFKFAKRNVNLFRKIIRTMPEIPMPGELKNLIKTSIAFSNPADPLDYLRRLFSQINPNPPKDLKDYQAMGFTVREIEILTNISKSKVSRTLGKEWQP